MSDVNKGNYMGTLAFRAETITDFLRYSIGSTSVCPKC